MAVKLGSVTDAVRFFNCLDLFLRLELLAGSYKKEKEYAFLIERQFNRLREEFEKQLENKLKKVIEFDSLPAARLNLSNTEDVDKIMAVFNTVSEIIPSLLKYRSLLEPLIFVKDYNYGSEFILIQKDIGARMRPNKPRRAPKRWSQMEKK